MADTGIPPVVPPEFRQYEYAWTTYIICFDERSDYLLSLSSYAEAPAWQLKFSGVWVSGVGLFVLFFLPHFIRGLRAERVLHDVFGVREKIDGFIALYNLETDDVCRSNDLPMQRVERVDWRKDWIRKVINRIGAIVLWTIPWVELNVGQRKFFVHVF